MIFDITFSPSNFFFISLTHCFRLFSEKNALNTQFFSLLFSVIILFRHHESLTFFLDSRNKKNHTKNFLFVSLLVAGRNFLSRKTFTSLFFVLPCKIVPFCFNEVSAQVSINFLCNRNIFLPFLTLSLFFISTPFSYYLCSCTLLRAGECVSLCCDKGYREAYI